MKYTSISKLPIISKLVKIFKKDESYVLINARHLPTADLFAYLVALHQPRSADWPITSIRSFASIVNAGESESFDLQSLQNNY